VLDLNETLEGMLKMLRRLIGEDIDLFWKPGLDLWKVKMDPSQIDQILANLSVNARDAISGTGKVTIETENVTLDEAYCAGHAGFSPGQYVQLAVSDDGCGMDPETLEHIFEPFFTTKKEGAGTGLGLSTVYGIAKQNGGFINVYSEPGKGTAVKIYLPRFEGKASEALAESAAEVPQGHGETVLLIEDEESILKLGQKILERLGYTVLSAGTPGEALRLAETHAGEIHLLITDVVMPEMNGRDLAERIVSIKPGLKCLFMSGYTANAITHSNVLDEGMQFIQKPFSLKNLAAKVREVLDQG
jgi:CheY-like chemotaxis protein